MWNTGDTIVGVGSNLFGGQIKSWVETGGASDGRARGTLNSIANSTAGDTVTVGSTTLTAGTDFLIGISADQTCHALADAISKNWSAIGAAVPLQGVASDVVEANAAGTAGNRSALASSNTSAITVSGATLTGGNGGYPGNWSVLTRAGFGVSSAAGVSADNDTDATWTATQGSDYLQMNGPITTARNLQLQVPRGDVGVITIERGAGATGNFCRNVQTSISGTYTTIVCLMPGQNVRVRYNGALAQWVLMPNPTQVSGQVVAVGLLPTVNAGAGAVLAAGSTNAAGSIQEGASATAGSLTFNPAYPVAPFCTVTSPAGGAQPAYAVSATGISFTNPSGVTGMALNYACIGPRQ